MGEAKRRGTAEQRAEEATLRDAANARAAERMRAANERMQYRIAAEAKANKGRLPVAVLATGRQLRPGPAGLSYTSRGMMAAALVVAMSHGVRLR